MERSVLYDKIAGCLMAGALGDALGYAIEFSGWNSIQRRYGEGGIRAMPVERDGKARISDDTQMTLFTNEGMVLGYWRAHERGISAEVESYIYQAYLCWYMSQGGILREKPLWAPVSRLLQTPELNTRRAPGNTCLDALSSGKMGSVDAPINNSKGCGGVMRTAPVGFMRCWGSALEKGAEAAAITHGHPGGWAPAGMLSDMVQRLIYGDPDAPLKDVVLASLKATEARWDLPGVHSFADMVRKAVRYSATDMPDVAAIHALGGGWVGDEALAIAVYSCLKHPDDPKAALISAVNHSGDSDSTGAIAGNILGAKLGLSALPQDWIDQLELTDVILEQAERMTEAAAHSLRLA